MTAKKNYCKDKPRCAACPLVLMRLEKMGHADRDGKHEFRVSAKVPKKALVLARAR